MRSGASTHSLAGHVGAVLSVAWSPREEHVVASGSIDGTVRLWDVRRSASTLGFLDMDDSVGIGAGHDTVRDIQRRPKNRSHTGPVNGLVWTEDGSHIISCGHDRRIRVWDAVTKANTLANFGPSIKNSYLSTLIPLLAPKGSLPPGVEIMFYPNERDILVFDLFEGKHLKSLRPASTPGSIESQVMQRSAHARPRSLAWRAGSVEMYSGHTDGSIRAWMPRTKDEAELDADSVKEEDAEEESKKRKRQVLEDIHQSLTRPNITFG